MLAMADFEEGDYDRYFASLKEAERLAPKSEVDYLYRARAESDSRGGGMATLAERSPAPAAAVPPDGGHAPGGSS